MSNNKSLKTQLKEKEELVAALTERLELAAEQLDRFQRSGADQNLRSSGGGFSPELIERHESLVDELQQAVQQWNNMQAGAALGNLEMQVSEIRDLVASNSSGIEQSTWKNSLIETDDSRTERQKDNNELSDDDTSAAEQETRWDSLKSHLMGADSEPTDNLMPTALAIPGTSKRKGQIPKIRPARHSKLPIRRRRLTPTKWMSPSCRMLSQHATSISGFSSAGFEMDLRRHAFLQTGQNGKPVRKNSVGRSRNFKRN